MVTATVSPAGCDGSVEFDLSVACLQLQGSDGPGMCANANGLVTAQVFTRRTGRARRTSRPARAAPRPVIRLGRSATSSAPPPRPCRDRAGWQPPRSIIVFSGTATSLGDAMNAMMKLFRCWAATVLPGRRQFADTCGSRIQVGTCQRGDTARPPRRQATTSEATSGRTTEATSAPHRGHRRHRRPGGRRGDDHHRQYEFRRAHHGGAGSPGAASRTTIRSEHSVTSQTAGQFDVHVDGNEDGHVHRADPSPANTRSTACITRR